MILKKTTEEEKTALIKIRRLRRASLILLVLFLPFNMLAGKIFSQKFFVISVFYMLIMGIFCLRTSFIKCPRCKDYYHMWDPFSKKYLQHPNQSFSSWNQCQNCDLRMKPKTKLEKKFFG